MKRSTFLTFFFILVCSQSVYSRTFVSIKNGNFDDTTIWDLNKIPSVDGDTIVINHSVIFDRDIDTIGDFSYDMPYFKINKLGMLCFDRNYTYINLFIEVFGTLNARRMEIKSHIDVYGFMYSNRQRITIGGRVSIFRGRGVVDSIIYSCKDSIDIDTQQYTSSCPKALYLIEKELINDSTLKFDVYSNLPMTFEFVFIDTTIEVKQGESFTYNLKDRDSITVDVDMTDYCDRTYLERLNCQKSIGDSTVSSFVIEVHENEFQLLRNGSEYIIDPRNMKDYIFNLFSIHGEKLRSEHFRSSYQFDLSLYEYQLFIVGIFDDRENLVYSKKIKK